MLRVQKSSSLDKGTGDSQHKLGARSCLACHRRKVRCDRAVPCTNCSKGGLTCVYPTKNREEQKSPTLQCISDRLGRLETLLSHLVKPRVSAAPSGDSESQIQREINLQSTQRDCKTWELLLNDGKIVQYVNNSNIRDLLQNGERMQTQRPSVPDLATPQLQNCTSAHASPSQPGSCPNVASNVLKFYPDSHLALQLWALYVKSVDPVLKILHIPTTQSAVIATILDPKSASASMLALTFAIYFAALTTLDHTDEPIELPMENSVLLKHYKTALDRLLLVTEVMNRPEMAALQALAIYTTCLRVHETGRSAWVLNGLAIRLAQSIGLHRDGATFRLSPFDTEMRLRLWWHLCVLDSRAPEDQGFELTIDVLNRGLRLPLNIDDNQLFPSMTKLPAETVGWTEMSFFLIQTESCRLLHPVLGTREHSPPNTLPDITAKRQMIQERTQYILFKYGISSKTPGQLPLIAMQHLTTACKKMEFMLQLREEIDLQKQEGVQDDTTDVLRPSFKLACDGLESSFILLKGGLSLGFKWLFTTYTPWYALAYVLRCLSNNPCEQNTERAWALVEGIFPQELSLNDVSETREEDGHGSIWKCLALLRYQAQSSRISQRSANNGTQTPVEHRAPSSLGPVENIQETEPPPAYTTPHVSAFSGYGMITDEELMADPNQNLFSSFDFSMSRVPYLPEWNAVIHGSLMDESNPDLM